MSSEREDKRLVHVSKGLVDRLYSIALRQETTIRKVVEDAIKYYLEVNELGYSFEEAVGILRAFKMLRVFGGVFVPSPMLECLRSRSCDSRDQRARSWYELGKSYGIYVKGRYGESLKMLEALLKTMRWDLSDISVDTTGNSYKLRCASPMLSDEDTQYLAEFVKGFLEGLEARISRLEIMRGLLVVEFSFASQQKETRIT